MNWRASSAMVMAIVFSVVASGAELKPETAREWDAYLVRVNARTMGRTQHDFLWVDDSEQRLQRARAGEIVFAPIQPKMPIRIRHGLLHHWMVSFPVRLRDGR